MKPAPFDYFAPTSVPDVLALLQQYGADARVLAGGQSLVRLMNSRLASPSVLIDINGVTDLDQITTDGDMVVIRALVKQRTAELSDTVVRRIPVLAEAGGHVAHVSVRQRGTVVGSIAFADPSAELPAALLALNGTVVAEGPAGRRSIAGEDFFVGPWQNSLTEVELATEIRLPELPVGRTVSAFVETSRRHGELPVCGVAVVLGLSSDGSIEDARIALCAVDRRPVRARAAEALLQGGAPSTDAFEQAAWEAARNLEPIANCHGSADFRRHLARVLTGRALETARSRIPVAAMQRETHA
jgi:carbon-monoxide dehydrogenase medium subunit